MKRFYYRFRILLLTLALGLASVAFFNGLGDRQREIPVNIPQIKSESPLYVHPWQSAVEPQDRVKEIIKQGRNLSQYDFGGEVSNCVVVLVRELAKCEKEKGAVRNFILKHWQDKKLAYLVYNVSGMDAGVEYHIVIEPDENGDWRMLWFGERWGMPPNEGTFIEDVRQVKLKRAGRDDYPYEVGTKYLSFLDKDGQEIERW
jgi:hypothetical protein